jgi:DNA (cytosine-5)-methyltransferase 1
MRFGSVCSGIEAASVAWGPLGWEAAWFSEIEPFPCAVLKHHYPDVPNHGDMSTLPDRIRAGKVEAPDLFCGGTPCQAFSVAGLRRSLDDDRGNLSLIFCEVANAIDAVRSAQGERPSIVFWENVPGVLSTEDNAFGCFLAGLAGESVPLEPAGRKWTNAGVVLGPTRAVAWRVLDAQYFGVAQRRRRVFVVASARDDFDCAAVLFEREGLRRDIAPSRTAGEAVAAYAASSIANYREGIGCLRAQGGDLGGGSEILVAYAFHARASSVDQYGDVSGTLDTDGQTIGVHTLHSVRRLTPRECERLQGFPDDYTAIPYKNKSATDCPDGPRYKALGNSWAVPVVRWIGNRIQQSTR